jgi:alginate O-acetyltransferase complex protein AlgI
MLPETLPSEPPETGRLVDKAPAPQPKSLARHAFALARFLAVVAQFGLIVLVMRDWQLENALLSRLMDLAFVGFIIHHLLPIRFRLPFFAMLSLVAIVFGLGETGMARFAAVLTARISLATFLYPLIPGVTLVGIGLGLIGLCHLPIRFGGRVAAVAVAAAGLSVLRANSQWFPDIKGMWVIFGSMFMFRLMIYLYDLKHRTAPFSPARAISYFFMLPNVCFPLFPVVDYKTFSSTYYNEDWPRVYQTGLKWMFRGVIQLLLYRVVYQYAPLDVSKLSSALDVAGCMLGMYLLYLRVSGTFHLIVGLLHMFGFNLPETHHLYFLATSFTDVWRRINIYWKDFVMKLFFYPTHFKLRKMGTVLAMSVATLATFLATWLLHSWQWFWIRGVPLLTWKDFSFWVILALLVLATALYEATWGRKRTLTPSRVTLRRRLMLGVEAAGVFCLMCILWTFWTCQSWAEFQTLIDAASRPTLRDVAIVLAALGTICVCGMVWGRSSRETSEGRSTQEARKPFSFWPSAGAVSVGALCLLAAPSVATRTIPSIQYIVARLHSDVLNARDLALQRRGYYEELDVAPMGNWQWSKSPQPEDWGKGNKVFYRQRSDFMLTDIAPSVSTVLEGAPIRSNSLGMRDREYDTIKPPNTYRIVLLGASHDQGNGVKENETYENLVEDRLNHELPDLHYSRYEILNMSLGNTGLFQRLLRLEQQGFQFKPDAAILSVSAVDQPFFARHLSHTLSLGIEPPPGYREIVERVTRKAGIHGKMPKLMIERRLQPYMGELYEWTFHRFAQQCEQHGIHPVVIYRPEPVDFGGRDEAGRSEVIGLARAAGLEVIDLSPAFDSVTDRNTLVIAKWDHHTTALGHRLLADKLYQGLVPLLFGSSSKKQASRLQKP